MRAETRIINGKYVSVITAKAGKVFMRKHDGFIMGTEIALGYDYSTGEKREDNAEYYEEVDKPEDME